jgi:hypothetical protein
VVGEWLHFALCGAFLLFLLCFDFAGHLVLLSATGLVWLLLVEGGWVFCRIQSGIALAWDLLVPTLISVW